MTKYSQEVLMCLTGQGDPKSVSFIIGQVLVFERLWRECGLYSIINQLPEGRKFEFDV